MRTLGVLCAVAALSAVSTFAQLNRGAINGTTTDPSGALIPQVHVVVQNMATNARYETTTTEAGQYSFPNLPPGEYQLTFQAPNFKRSVRSGIPLRVGEVLRVDMLMDVGTVTESVQVSAEIPRVQTDSAEVGTTFKGDDLMNLPLSIAGARHPEAFAYKLAPGVSGSNWVTHINGSREASKEVLLDGATVTTERAGSFSESAVSPEAIQEFRVQTSGMSAEYGRTQVGVFNFVMKSGANQIHGSAYGGLRREWMNANTFSNKFSGRPRPLDRRHDYAGSFGGPVYLPKIYDGRNRTFFYTSYEHYAEKNLGVSAPNKNAPLPEWYDGDLSRLLGPVLAQTDALGRPVARGAVYDPRTFTQLPNGRWIGDMFPGNIIPVSRFSDVSRRVNEIARKHYLPTERDANGQFPLVRNAVGPSGTRKFDQYNATIKVDQVISDKHKLSGSLSYIARPRIFFDQGGRNNLFDQNDPLIGGPFSSADFQRVRHHLVRLAWDWTVSPRILQNLTVHYNRMINPHISLHSETDGAKELGIANLSTIGYPQINWGAGPIVTLSNIGDTQASFSAPMGWGLANTWNFTRGRHLLKWGVDLRTNATNTRPGKGGNFNFAARSTAIPNEPFSGSQTGYSFASYLLGIVDTASLSDPVGLGPRRAYAALFLNDDFKVTERFTLNLGVRWEYQPPVVELYDRMASWNLNKIDPKNGRTGAYDFVGSCAECTGSRYFGRKQYNGIYPRFGFAWQPKGSWTVRGAYGIFVQALVGGTSSSSFAWTGTYNFTPDPINPWRGDFNWDAGFPTNRYIPPVLDVSRGTISTPTYVDPNFGLNPYTQTWNLNVQRQLPKQTLLEVGYVGNKGTRLPLPALTRFNQLPASVLSQYGRNLSNPVTNPTQAAANNVAYPFTGFSGTVAGALRDYPQIPGTATFSANNAPIGFSNYHSMQVVVNKQFTQGLTLYANYVWSRVMTDGDSSLLDVYNRSLEKAAASWDIPHMVKAYVDYQLPFGRGQKLWTAAPRVVNALISGWNLSAIMNYESGSPLSFSGASSPFPNGWNGGQRLNVAPGQIKVSGFDKSKFDFANINNPVNTYFNKALFTDPAPFTLGTGAVRYSEILGFGVINEDIGILKNNKIGEKYSFQLRAELLNAFNRHNLGGINTTWNNPNFGQVTSVSGNRTMQIGARLQF
jgi:hypothetical protein